MRSVFTVSLAWLVVLVLNQAVALTSLVNGEYSLIYSRDLVLLVAGLVVLASTRLHRFWLGLTSLAWVIIVLFEWIRAVGQMAMKQSPLLYDAYFLAGHLYILLRDLMGFKATLIFLAVGGALVAIWCVSHLLFRWMSRKSIHLSGISRVLFILGLGAMVYVADRNEEVQARSSLSEAWENVDRSLAVYNEIKLGVKRGVYQDIDAVELVDRPRVHIYIVESYGRAVLSKRIRKDFLSYRSEMARRFKDAGWHMATGLSEAPVMGGRSWLADATLLSGRTVKYESVYRHLTPRLKDINSIPSFFRDRGYRTVLMRPKDKARPGVELVNHFGFTDTVFHEDLDYQGRNYGWVEIPDQFALGHIRDVVMPTLDGQPEFVFAHLGSSHIPWDEIPPILEDWRKLDDTGKRRIKKTKGLTQKEIKFQLKRFKRQGAVRLRRLRPTPENLSEYFQAIRYSLEVVTRHILDMADPPDLIVVMGDHQPPMYKRSKDFSVPMHILARDPALLEGFREHGFTKTAKFGLPKTRIYHEGFFSLLVGAIAEAQGLEPPAFHRQGFGISKTLGSP